MSNVSTFSVLGVAEWSGGVLPVELPGGMRISILNPTHSRGRHKSTLMEEIATPTSSISRPNWYSIATLYGERFQ